ncbi:type 2 periplasmic-binding domain-containing protein [Varunaivibrio sulfuroxidans]|uniref:hypothetical protein n=1 Tax=Varunaivibrio sulfuroxidans TaxID=1773489 RepID=UPI001A9E8280|nr:hypothetical protein [Varunaivibrio sulfuroxidans]WES31970.1 hypothetical protein P3M64_06340 [Varunaivibrio sulfuroxidans]
MHKIKLCYVRWMSKPDLNLRAAMHSFALPFAMAEITVSLFWHPRLDGDPAHRWPRGRVRDACAVHNPGAAARRADGCL